MTIVGFLLGPARAVAAIGKCSEPTLTGLPRRRGHSASWPRRSRRRRQQEEGARGCRTSRPSSGGSPFPLGSYLPGRRGELRSRVGSRGRRMSAVLDELGLTRLATSIPGLSAVGAAAILAQDLRPAAVRHCVRMIKHVGLAPREKLSGVCVRPPRFERTDRLRAARRGGRSGRRAVSPRSCVCPSRPSLPRRSPCWGPTFLRQA